MKWSARDLRTALAVQAIERARRTGAEARLRDAHQEEEQARSDRERADAALKDSTKNWSAHLRSGHFDLALCQALAGAIIAQERAVEAASRGQTETEALVERRSNEWRDLNAGVRSGEAMLSRGRRSISRRSEENRTREIAESTTWKWFER